MEDAVLIVGMIVLIYMVGWLMCWDLDITRRKAERWVMLERMRDQRIEENIVYEAMRETLWPNRDLVWHPSETAS